MSDAARELERLRRRVDSLNEISKVFATWRSLEETFEDVVELAAETLPLRTVVLVVASQGGPRTLLWPREAAGGEAAPRDHAEAAFSYFAENLPGDFGSGAARRPMREQDRFIALPVVVSRRPIFGVLQLEPAGRFDRYDLSFGNAIANQLALALDRQHARRREVDRRKFAERERARAEAEQTTGEALRRRFEGLVDNLDHAFVWEADARTLHLFYVSGRADNLNGPTADALPGKEGWMGQVVDEDWPALAGAFARAATGEGDQRCEHRCHTRFGIRWFQTRVHLAEGPGGHRLQGVSLDVTPERQLSEAQALLLAAGKALAGSLDFRSGFQTLAGLTLPRLGDFCVCHEVVPGGDIRVVAWAHADLSSQRLLDEQWAGGLSAPSRSAVLARVIRSGRSEISEAPELAALPELGEGPLLVVPLMRAEESLGALSFGFTQYRCSYSSGDIALAEELGRRTAVALENARLYEQSRRATEVREQILAIVSHDLRNPLSRIQLAAGLLDRRAAAGGGTELIPRTLTTIRQAVDQMRHLIDDLLDFANIEAGRLSVRRRPELPGVLLDDAVAAFEPAAQQGEQRLSARAQVELPPVACDRLRILQVLGNLVGNALKVVPAGGAIELGAELQTGQVVFSVADTGPGIAPEEQVHLFERYWRGAEPRYRGSGLGLAIARGLVEAHGGRIWVRSTPGQGATFQFSLPVWEGGPAAAESPQEASRP